MSNRGISTKQKAAIRALITGASYPDAARAAKVHENTVGQWMKDPAFLAALHQAEAEAMAAVSRSLVAIADKASGVLDDVLTRPNARDSSKVRAADVVLGWLMQFKELSELADRLKQVEEQLKEVLNGKN